MGALGRLLETAPARVAQPPQPTLPENTARIERACRGGDGQWVWETIVERVFDGGGDGWDDILREIGHQKSPDTAYRVKWLNLGGEVRRSAHFPVWGRGGDEPKGEE